MKKHALAVEIDFIHHINGDEYKFEGYVNHDVVAPGETLVFKTGEKTWETIVVERAHRVYTLSDGTEYTSGAFETTVHIGATKRKSLVEAVAVGNNGMSRNLSLHPKRFTGLSKLRASYRPKGKVILRKERGTIAFYPNRKKYRLRFEARIWLQILLNWRLRPALVALRGSIRDGRSTKEKVFNVVKPLLIVGEAIATVPRAYVLRVAYFRAIRRKNRPIWLVSDRGMAARDNGEAFFRYAKKQSDCPADIYFIISKKSPDYDRLFSLGNVVDQDSLRYKLLFLLADKIISSHADIETTNPFIRQGDHFIDLFRFDFVFLQHGIIKHDLSSWLNRFDKNIDIFITSAKREYDSILLQPYYYAAENVVLSGLPRYDLLESEPKGKLIVAPTYRRHLLYDKTNKNGMRPYNSKFKSSEYYKFYQRLMNDTRLHAVLKKHTMTGEFYLHPTFAAQTVDFVANDFFDIMSFPYDYSAAFKKGDVMVSDYSSALFDFAYLKKPIVYSQFDRDVFFEGHIYKPSDLFSDEKDGFGPVTYTYDSLVDTIIDVIEAGCVMESKYSKRVDNFFYKTDKSNCKRVYDAIIKR